MEQKKTNSFWQGSSKTVMKTTFGDFSMSTKTRKIDAKIQNDCGGNRGGVLCSERRCEKKEEDEVEAARGFRVLDHYLFTVFWEYLCWPSVY